MGIGAAVAAIGVGLQVAGFAQQQSAMKKQTAANVAILNDQRRQEAVRQQAMSLDAARRKRDIIRQGILAQSVAQTRATQQGAATTGSSALPGAFGQINGATDRNLLTINQSEGLGNQMFALNNSITNNRIRSSQAGSDAAFGGGLMSLGGALIKNEGTFDRVGTYLTSSKTSGPLTGTASPIFYGSAGMSSLY
jgi:hypothetical protein